jgi:choice-of-anchor A domain-containing protein
MAAPWVLATVVALAAAVPARADFIGLGQAGNYTMFVVSNTAWSMNNSTELGPIAAGPGVTYSWSGGSGPYEGPVSYQSTPVTISGVNYAAADVPPVNSLGGTPKPAVNPTNLSQAVLDARAAASSAAAQARTNTSLTSITNTTGTITGTGGQNVYDLTSVNMSGGSVLINGTANDTFIFRVSGDFNVGNASIRVSGGVTPNHVLWYFPNTSTIKSPTGAWDGTILALNSGVSFDNTPNGLGPVRGAIIASDDKNNNQNYVFSVLSGFDIVSEPFEPAAVPLPATAGGITVAMGALTIGKLGRRRRARAAN